MRARRWRDISRPTALVAILGAALTAVLTWSAATAADDNEDRLITERTAQAAAVLEAAVPAVEVPLAEVAALTSVLGDDGLGALERTLETLVGDRGRFVSASLWSSETARPTVIAGVPPALTDRSSAEIRSMLDDAAIADGGLVLKAFLDGDDRRLGYAMTSSADMPPDLVVYAEQQLPADRTSVVQPDSAFANLDYALYLGEEQDSQLLFASAPEVPITGRRATRTVSLGDRSLLLVMSPTGRLGGNLLGDLPWLVGGGGLSATVAGAVLVEAMQRRRRSAEALAAENERLYDQQQSIAHTLQQSLLPTRLPDIASAEFAAVYVAGAEGTEVGGDWYDVIEVDDQVVLVIGDVAGRGARSATVMAAMRYGVHTLAAQGIAPGTVLTTVNRLDGIRGDFVTMLCAAVDPSANTVTVATAGHPPPIVIADGKAAYLETSVGPPIGFLETTDYHADPLGLPEAATVLLFTDGLCERRDESIDAGLERLLAAATQRADEPLDDLIHGLLSDLVGDHARDDVAILAMRLRC